MIVMSSYDVIAQFYDSVVTDPAKKALWLEQLIRKYDPSAKSVLELACGEIQSAGGQRHEEAGESGKDARHVDIDNAIDRALVGFIREDQKNLVEIDGQ